ncbi:unnamed protein product [Acanthoscelides obtectus]|nr:unnamed protein product [Acanthoscelides obtectus]CAK1656604.1 HD domain-containing protein 2 [Acanthoscelides obtectus]
MVLVNNLKHFPRRGWAYQGVENVEQIAGHMYSMGMMTFFLGNDSKLDRLKCLQLAVVHDLAESIVGDITPHDNIPVEKKHQMEDEAMKGISKLVGDEVGSLIYTLYKEYEAKETPEAKFVKDLDQFDLLCTASYYENRDQTPGKHQVFFDVMEGKIKHPFIKKLVDTLEAQRVRQRKGHLDEGDDIKSTLNGTKE